MGAYYGVQWGDAVRAVRDEREHLGSLPRPALRFLREHGEQAQYLVWRATYFRPASAGSPPDTAPAAVRRAAAGGVPECAAYLARTGHVAAYVEFAAEQYERVQTRREAIGEHLFYILHGIHGREPRAHRTRWW